MSNQNHFFFGNLTRDPELRNINGKNGATSVTAFTVAINGRKDEEPEYYDCEAWGITGETIAKHLKRGDGIVVTSSKTKTDKWEDKETKQKKSRIKFIVNEFGFLPGGKKAEGGNEEATEAPAPTPRRSRQTVPAPAPVPALDSNGDGDGDDSDIPF